MGRLSQFRAAFVTIALLGGWSTGQAQVIAKHPSEDNLRVEGRVLNVSRADSVTGLGELDQTARRLRKALRVDSVGKLDGDAASVLGTIMDVVVDDKGRLLVLDMAFQMIRVFGPDGTPEFTVGQSGNGPLDFRFPVAIWTETSGEVVVVDAQLGAKYLSMADRLTVKLDRVVRLDGSPTGACGSRGILYAYSPSLSPAPGVSAGVERVIRMHDAQGKIVRAFGDSYRNPSPLVRGIMSEGTVGCPPGGGVISALSKLPFVHWFDDTGAQRWSIRFTDFTVGTELEQTDSKGRHAIGIDPKNPTASYIRRITPLGPRFTAVQIALMTPQSLRDRTLWANIDTYVVDNQAGRAAFVSSKLPLLSHMHGTRLIGFENDPFPHVVIMRVEN